MEDGMHRFALYSPLSKWPKGGYPLSPFVQLSVGTYLPESDGRILLSTQLMTPGEIDYVVDQFQAELEEFRVAAKKELQKLHEKMLQK
jgi:hypothetical protein